ncbi:MAG: 4-alpha-glucanotransferase [Thermodesulforhabdaceae bacterium]|jgi:4-alpha-glucanotransferase
MDFQSLISCLADHYGILPGYWDIWGNYHETSLRTRIAILAAMGVKAENEAEARKEVGRILESLEWKVPYVTSTDEGTRPGVSITCRDDLIPPYFDWSIVEESDEHSGAKIEQWSGRIYRSECVISLPDVQFDDTWHRLPEFAGLSDRIRKIYFQLPVDLPCGYYRLTIKAPSRADHDEIFVIVAPRKAFWQEDGGLSAAFHPAASRLGLALQLYAVRSEKNWGIGNFRNLRDTISLASSLGAGFVGLNPLHLLYVENPDHISPYSPSSRRFLNPWYVAVEEVPEFEEARSLVPENLIAHLCKLRDERHINYRAVIPVICKAFEAMYDVFMKRHYDTGSSRFRDFIRFSLDRGEVLERYGIFEALRERLKTPWWEWRADNFEEAGSDVARRANFFRYLQFITHEQLVKARDFGHGLNPAVKLYLDLSVSVDAGGFDAWYDRSVYTLGARVGAPPDDFNPRGQEWGVIPMVPHKLAEARYRPFIETLRSSMKYADILRIDHVMGFFRLFWIPEGLEAVHGAYVRYPMEDMARIIALESVRNRCVVIGEDLGTVPDEVREEMARREFLSYRVFYFEKHSDGSFKKPSEYPDAAIATVTTHDLPTFRGYWMERDIDVRSRLGMISKKFEDSLREQRARDRRRILEAISQEGFWCPECEVLEENSEVYLTREPPSEDLIIAVHRYLTKSRARLVVFQMDDLLGEEDQPNLPGTTTQYPCWRIRWNSTLENIRLDELRKFF